jgi:hypothetical protein
MGPGNIDSARTGAVPAGKQAMVRDRRWRAGLLAPLLFLIGSLCWLAGSAAFVSEYRTPRVSVICAVPAPCLYLCEGG